RARHPLFGLKPGDQPVARLDLRFGGIAGRRLAAGAPAEPRVVLVLLGLPLQVMPLNGPADTRVVEIVAAVAAGQGGFELAQQGVKIVGRLPQVARQFHELGATETAPCTGEQAEGPRDEAAAEL